MSGLRAGAAIARVTLLEAWRQRLWLVFAAVAALFLLVVPRLHAVDDSARLKLSVVVITSATSFVVVLLAILIAASCLRRDFESRSSFMLFSKPLSSWAYVLGRWTGVQLGLLAGIIGLSAVGISAIALQSGHRLPQMVHVIDSNEWQQVSASSEVIGIAENKERVYLGGAVGNGVRWRFSRLDSGRDYQLLLRASISSSIPEVAIEEAHVRVSASSGADGKVAQRLELDPDSPYGRSAEADETVVLRDRDDARKDFAQDYLRLIVPASVIAADGSVTIQVTRLDARSGIAFERFGSAKLAHSAGGFALNLLRGGLIVLAMSGVLVAVGIFCAVMSNIGVSLLGGLTWYFAASALPVLQEAIEDREVGLAIRRLLQIALWILPDFSKFDIAADLAASREISWASVGSAWTTYGVHIVAFLLLAWLALRRKEL